MAHKHQTQSVKQTTYLTSGLKSMLLILFLKRKTVISAYVGHNIFTNAASEINPLAHNLYSQQKH